MRIVFAGDTIFPDSMGGSHRYTYELAQRLAKAGHEVIVVIPCLSASSPIDEIVGGVRYLRYEKKSGLYGLFSYIVGTYQTLNTIFKESNTPTHVEAFWPLPMLAIRIFKKIHRITFSISYTFHGPWSFEASAELGGMRGKLLRRIMIPFERWFVSNADYYITLSSYMKDMLSDEIGGTSKSNVTVIPGGVETRRFRNVTLITKSAARQRLGLPIDLKIYVTVRRLRRRMGLENLIRAFAEFSKIQSKSLLVIGGRGPLSEELKVLVDELGMKDRISLVGFVSDNDLPYLYRAADFFLLPSISLEGFGLVTVECLASGTPVLGTNVGAIPEVLSGLNKELVMSGFEQQDILASLCKSFDLEITGDDCSKYAAGFDWDEVMKKRKQLLF